MRVDVLTREYPPSIYGGAGVHVTELVRALRADAGLDVRVHAFDGPREEPGTTSHPDLPGLADANAAVRTLGVDLSMVGACAGADLVHSHTWYANMAGHLAGLMHDVPHVVTAHSLEPLRPWKAEQLGGGYRISSWAERTAYEGAAGVIAVSSAMRDDVLRCYPWVDPTRVHVVHNGIDTTDWAPVDDPDRVRELGVDPDRPSVVFVGRITRQKGLPLFLRAAASLPPEVQLVLCAGAPDTPEIMAEVEGLVDGLRAERSGVVWIAEMLPRRDVCALLTQATTFACPSIYEPLGIVNLEAMACRTAVVATATGGIPEVVVPSTGSGTGATGSGIGVAASGAGATGSGTGVSGSGAGATASAGEAPTGWLVPIDQADDGTGTPLDPEKYVRDLGDALCDAVADPDRARAFGEAGHRRAVEHFGWPAIAERTREVYQSLV